MRVMFKKAKYGGLTGRLIALWSRGPYCHVEVSVYGTQMFSSDGSDGGVRLIDFGHTRGEQYDYFELPQPHGAALAEVMSFIWSQAGKKYDWIGVFGFVFPWLHDDKNDWFCSEICSVILSKLGLLSCDVPCKVTPNDLFKHLKSKYPTHLIKSDKS